MISNLWGSDNPHFSCWYPNIASLLRNLQGKQFNKKRQIFPRLPLFYFEFVNQLLLHSLQIRIPLTFEIKKTCVYTRQSNQENKHLTCSQKNMIYDIYEAISISLLFPNASHSPLPCPFPPSNSFALLGAWYRTNRKRELGKTSRRTLARHFNSSLAQFAKKQNSTNLTNHRSTFSDGLGTHHFPFQLL